MCRYVVACVNMHLGFGPFRAPTLATAAQGPCSVNVTFIKCLSASQPPTMTLAFHSLHNSLVV
uniref:Uncharacterized protein n=1 Tax=Oryza punctata TaxID=4537 RepID=A0A0E0JM88_ORYPU